MKKAAILFFCLIFILFQKPAFAHVLETDGNIGAVIHIDPDDDPIVGQPASFYFEFKDKTNKFKASECDCKISVSLRGNELISADLFSKNSSPGLTNSIFTYVFSQKGIYTITVNGMPNTTGAFQSFKLNYDIRVDRLSSKTQASQNTHGVMYRVAAIIAIVILFAVLVLSNRKKSLSGKKLAVALVIGGAVTLLHICHSSQLLAQLEHHNHHSSQEHPCCIQQIADFSAAPSIAPEKWILSEQIYDKRTAVSQATQRLISIRSPPSLLS